MNNWSQVINVSDVLGDVFGLASAKFLELGGLSPGHQVLDVACGGGGLSRSARDRVSGNSGRVVAIDQNPDMIAAATSRSADLADLQYVAGDAATIGSWGEIFDTAFCRFGLPFLDDPSAVLEACHSTLKPGGRMCIMGVGGPENNAFFTLLGAEGGALLHKVLEEGNPLGVAHKLEEAGFVNVATKEIRALVTVSDLDAYWAALRGLLGVPQGPVPASVAQGVSLGAKLPVSLVFALGYKRDPSVPDMYTPKTFEEYIGSKKRGIREINPQGIKAAFKKQNVVFLDVRDPDTVAASIRGSVAITRDFIELTAPQHIPSHDTAIVTYCSSGDQGTLAACQLEKMGYINVWNLQGGMDAWEHNGMPTI